MKKIIDVPAANHAPPIRSPKQCKEETMIIVSRERNRMNKIDIKILGEVLKNGQEAMENIKYTAEKLGLKIVKDEEVNK